MDNKTNVDFRPTLKGYSGQGAFRFWCQLALPLTFDDSLSYYELLNKVVTYLNNTIDDVKNVEDNVEALYNAYNNLQNYVNTYFDEIDIEEELSNVLDRMAEDGSLDSLLDPIVASRLGAVVAEQINAVVANQIGGVVSEQIGGTVAEQLPTLANSIIPDAVTDWLDENVTPTSPVVDNTLTISGAAADAKVTGDNITDLKEQIEHNISERLTDIDGIIVPEMEIGAIAFASTNIAYQNSTTAIRTPSGKAVRVTVGDVIGLSDYTDGKQYKYAILKDSDNSYTYSGARTADYTVRDNGLLYIVANYSDSRTIQTNDPLLYMVRIKTTSGKIANLENEVNSLAVAVDATGANELYIGSLVNAHLTASGLVNDSYDNYRLSSENILILPCGSKRKLKVHINPDYLFSLRIGADARNLDIAKYWFADGDEIVIDDGANYYGVSICNKYGGGSYTAQTISPDEDIGLTVTYEDENNINIANSEAEKILSNARLYFSITNHNSIDKYAIIGHTSDCHGDYKRVENFFDFCDHVGADVACVTGDIVSFYPKDGMKWFHELAKESKVLPAICVGNHDVNDGSLTDSGVYDYMFNDIATELKNTIGKTWYYTDIAAKKLRIISVNLYQYGGTSRWYTHFTPEQITWLINTLASTPQDYGVIILSHSPQVDLDRASVSGYTEFFQTERQYNTTHNPITGGVPLYDIVDAFISKTTLSKTYTQTGSDSSLQVTADFSNVASGVEFIAHLTGHFHQDSVCYIPNTINRQLMLNVTCTIAAYGPTGYPYLANLQDQGRNFTDSSQDAFNIYVIDRDAKSVKIVRIGNNKNYKMVDRKYMEIPYSD